MGEGGRTGSGRRRGRDGEPEARRLWWCPTGLFTLLPLHAAGRYPADPAGGRESALDRVVSSYTPTLGALIRARTRTPSPRQSLLAVGLPTTPTQSDLPAVPAELDAVEARIAIATRLQTPAAGEPSGDDPDSDPTVARVLAELERHTAVHLSCHGIQDVIVPTASAFWLADGPLTVGRLMAESGDGSGKNFAVLSACSTAASSVRTPDEALNLASAMGFAGYRHVVASLWAIHDALAPSFADRVYATPASPSGLAVDRAPLAVHQAVRELRAKYPDDPFAWAPYVHVGP